MARNTSISLGDHFTQFIDRQIDGGRYGSASDVVRAGLRLLEDHEAKLEALRAALLQGETSGPGELFDPLILEPNKMPTPADYFSFVAQDLKQRSDLVRQWYATHRPSAGANREDILQKLLRDFLPKRYTVSSGLALSAAGEFSNQADIFIADGLSSNPLIDANIPVWLVEAIYSLIEVKTYLGTGEIKDAMNKCQKFKSLPRNYVERPGQPIKDTLFVVWAFESPKLDTVLKNISNETSRMSDLELPDFIIVPDKFVITSGSYHALSTYGQPESIHRMRVTASGRPIDFRAYGANESNQHCLMMFIIWFLSWLDSAGPRSAHVPSYLPSSSIFGVNRSGRFN